MSLIEKAAQRLDQLKKANTTPDSVDVAGDVRLQSEQASPGLPPSERAPGDTSRTESAHKQVELKQPAVVSRSIEIDIGRLGASGVVTPDKPKSLLAEQFRVIKRPLISNARGEGAAPVRDGNLIMVTSALPGEGKSFSAINLAMSMAMELDFTVLLVDADFARPSILSKLGLPREKGLMDVLVGEVPDLADVILRTNVEKLALLPAGMPHPRATELIASDAMARMLKEISGRYPDRIVIFDSPPLLATTEARVLATHMGQILLVVEADRTTHSAVRQALATIEDCPIKLMMLNKAPSDGKSGLYGYGYGYGYGDDAGYRDASAKAA